MSRRRLLSGFSFVAALTLLVGLVSPAPARANLTREQVNPFGDIVLITEDGFGTIEVRGISPATPADVERVADAILNLANGNAAEGISPSPAFESFVEEATANRAGKVVVRVRRNDGLKILGSSNGEGALAVIAHEFRHAGIGKERIVTVLEDGTRVASLRDREDGEDQYRDPSGTKFRESATSPATSKNFPKGPAVEAENKVMEEAFAGSGFGYFRDNYDYIRTTDNDQVIDMVITVPTEMGSKSGSVIFNFDALLRLLGVKRNSLDGNKFVSDESERIEGIPELDPEQVFSPDGETTGTTGTTETTGRSGSDDETGGGGQASSDDDGSISCVPDSAMMSNAPVPQAGVSIDATLRSCEVVSGFPLEDQLVVDDLGGVFGGSGSGLTVLDVEGGSFVNEEAFYIIEDLEVGAPIRITFEDEEQRVFTVAFSIDDSGPVSALIGVSMEVVR